jgi:hypothetical protein
MGIFLDYRTDFVNLQWRRRAHVFCIKGAGLAWEFFWIASPQAARNDGWGVGLFCPVYLACNDGKLCHFYKNKRSIFMKQNVSHAKRIYEMFP